MKFKSKNESLAELIITNKELLIINNALNEVCNGIDLYEFDTRMGADLDEVRQLLAEVDSIIKSL